MPCKDKPLSSSADSCLACNLIVNTLKLAIWMCLRRCDTPVCFAYKSRSGSYCRFVHTRTCSPVMLRCPRLCKAGHRGYNTTTPEKNCEYVAFGTTSRAAGKQQHVALHSLVGLHAHQSCNLRDTLNKSRSGNLEIHRRRRALLWASIANRMTAVLQPGAPVFTRSRGRQNANMAGARLRERDNA